MKYSDKIEYTNVKQPGLYLDKKIASSPYVIEGSALNPESKVVSTGNPVVNIIDVDFCGLVLNKLVGEKDAPQSISNSSDLFEKINNMINQINTLSAFVESVMNTETK